MVKPERRTIEYWDYGEIIKYISEKYSLNENDMWDHLNDGNFNLHNGCYVSFHLDEDDLRYKNLPEDFAEVLYKEFGEKIMRVWIDW